MVAPESVFETVASFSDFILRYAVALAAVGALSMGLLEAIKAVFSLRDRFHLRLVRGWVETAPLPASLLAQLPPSPSARERPSLPGEPRARVYGDLIRLTTGESVKEDAHAVRIEWLPWDIGAANALFALELPRMLGQIQEAVDVALASPNLVPELYVFLTAGAADRDVLSWYEWAQQPPVGSASNPQLAKDQADTYTRLRQHVRRRLDALQLTASYRWQTGNQIAAVAVGAVLLYVSLLYLAGPKANVFLLLAASLIGGLMAPVAKDLVIALKRVRGGG